MLKITSKFTIRGSLFQEITQLLEKQKISLTRNYSKQKDEKDPTPEELAKLRKGGLMHDKQQSLQEESYFHKEQRDELQLDCAGQEGMGVLGAWGEGKVIKGIMEAQRKKVRLRKRQEMRDDRGVVGKRRWKQGKGEQREAEQLKLLKKKMEKDKEKEKDEKKQD